MSLFNREVRPFLANKTFGGSNVILSPFETLILIDDGKISETKNTIVWKGLKILYIQYFILICCACRNI